MKQISALVLLGKSTDEEQLGKALGEALGEHILGEQLESVVSLAVNARQRKIDPLFAAADGVARECFDRLNPKKAARKGST